MNKKQKLVLAIFLPIIVLFITFIIADSVGVTRIRVLPSNEVETSYANYWGKTWYVWLLSLVFCCFFEYKLFADKKTIINKKKK